MEIQIRIGEVLDRAVATISANTALLTQLDKAIGDGDHGVNMQRGFEALAKQRDELTTLPLSKALQKAGMTLVMTVGGASGPLYGSLLMGMGKALADKPVTAETLQAAFVAGVASVQARGKAELGQKTMLDVLIPVSEKTQRLSELGGEAFISTAQTSLAHTREMIATKGRASFLAARSQGHLDPGATSSALLIEAVWGDTAPLLVSQMLSEEA